MSIKTQTPIFITTTPEFHHWKSELRRFGMRRTRYMLALGVLSEEENQTYSNLINGYSKECGCNTGSMLMAWSCIGSVVLYFAMGGTVGEIGLHDVLWLAAVMLLGALSGKLLGLMRARWKLINVAEEIEGRLHMIHA